LKEKAIESSAAPLFKFSEVKPTEVKTVENGRTRETETLKFKLQENNLRIINAKFGKTITPDGSVYDAEEIIVHTPAEHQIDGKKYDMELQIIHNGKSVGDIGKQLILSFLFEKKAGIYNKFIDDLDFFNLPNPISPVVDIVHNLFIPKILYSTDDKETKMKPFSFYTYQGSLTAPPCSEESIIYVASRPIEIGTTALHLFQEALRVPDIINEKGDITVSDLIPISNRNIQPLNGRPVFHYDHEKNCGPDKDKKKDGSGDDDIGHYEKIRQVNTKYFYVPDQKISGIPNAFVVSKNEAMNIQDTKE
jgi:carbonic anhydrase